MQVNYLVILSFLCKKCRSRYTVHVQYAENLEAGEWILKFFILLTTITNIVHAFESVEIFLIYIGFYLQF